MRTFLKIVFSSILILGFNLSQGQVLLDKIIATVGSEDILLSDLEAQINYMKDQNPELPDDARCILLDQLMSSALMVHQARVDSVLVSDDEVETQLDSRIERIMAMMGNNMEQFIAQYGKTPSEIKDEQREDLKKQILGERMQGQLLQGATITPSEVIEFFDGIDPDSLPYFNSEVEIGEIVYKPVINEAEMTRARTKLEDVRRQIVDEGADFAKLAQENSEDYGSGRLGGDLGWSRRGQFVTEFEAAAYNLDKNEVSEVVETEFGFHLIQLLDKRGNSLNLRHILIRPQIQQIDLDNAEAYLDSIRNIILTDSLPFSFAVKRYGNDKVASYNNDGRIINQQTGTSLFDVGELDPDIYFTIDDMEIGQVSEPFQVTDNRGEPLFKVIKLLSRTDPHRASLKTDYSRIQQAALQQKRSGFLEEWLTNKITTTYVFLSAEYFECDRLAKWMKSEVIRP